MSDIEYIGAGGLFTHIGSVIAAIANSEFQIEDWEYAKENIQNKFEAGGQQAAMASLIGTIDQIQNSIATIRDSFGTICDARLQDFDTIIAEMGIPSDDLEIVLRQLIYFMVEDSQTVNGNVVTIGSVTPNAGNDGDGTILVSKILDGFSSPTVGASSHPLYYGLDSQFSVDDTMTVICAADSYSDNLADGTETFDWYGTKNIDGVWANGVEGAGDGPGVVTTMSGTNISNGDFERFSVTNTPDGWTIAAGTVTTNVAQTTTAGQFYRGLSALKLIGTGAAAAITLTQQVRLDPLRAYCCSVRYKASSAEGGGGKTFSVKLTGTGYTEGSTEKIEVEGTVLATGWTLASFFVNIPADPPDELFLTISFTGTPTVTIYVDDVGLVEVDYHNGVAAVAVPGATNFVRGDKFTFTVANSKEGIIQEYFRRNYLVQLPSEIDGTETISDGLTI